MTGLLGWFFGVVLEGMLIGFILIAFAIESNIILRSFLPINFQIILLPTITNTSSPSRIPINTSLSPISILFLILCV